MTTATVSSDNTTTTAKVPLRITREEVFWPLAFMLSMSMIGLRFPLGYLLAPVILINRFKHNRYDFIIMLSLMMGFYNLFWINDTIIKNYNVASILSLGCMVAIKKAPILRRIVVALVIYFFGLLFFCLMSDESMISQIFGVRDYLLIAYLFVPIAAFSGMKFDIRQFFHRLMIFAFIFCWFYILDSIVFGGFLLMPEDATHTLKESVFYDLNIHPISEMFIRRWPQGLYIFSLCAYPIARYYKLSRAQWAIIAVAFLISRSFTVTVGFVVAIFLAQRNFGKLLKYAAISLVGMVGLYFVDGIISGGGTTVVQGESGMHYTSTPLRIKSQIDQIIDFCTGNYDEETVAALGSTRGAQVVPKFELLYDLGKEWTGFGFLDRERTTNQKYIIINDLYLDVEKSEEVATGVEIIPAQVILSIGYLGLILHILFFVYLWRVLRRLPEAGLYLSSAAFFVVAGISGFCGLIEPSSLVLVGLACGVAILAAKPDLPGFAPTTD